MINRLIQLFDTFSEWSGRAVSWLTLLMVVITFGVVVLRYVFNFGWIAMQESVIYLHGMVFMIGAAYTLKHDGHVRVDIFYQTMKPRNRALVDLLGSLLLLLPMALFIIVVSWKYVSISWGLLEDSPESGGIPAVFLLKTLIPLMALVILIQGLSLVLRNLLAVIQPQTAIENKTDPGES